MEESYCGGINPFKYRHLKRIYELEDISEDEKDKYLNNLKKNNPETYSDVIELKEILENHIVNAKEIFLYGEEPILNIKIDED